MSTLHECIRELVAEAIARKPAEPKRLADLYSGKTDVPMQRPKFKLNEFKALTDVNECLTYATKTLQELGRGSAREVFRFTGSKVLKVAVNSREGIGQNEAEFGVFSNPNTTPVVAKIFEHDSSFKWIICEIVKPFERSSVFERETGIPWKTFHRSVEAGSPSTNIELTDEQFAFLENVIALIDANELLTGDILDAKHWGKSADGRVVTLDYGYTQAVDKTHYGADSYDMGEPDEE